MASWPIEEPDMTPELASLLTGMASFYAPPSPIGALLTSLADGVTAQDRTDAEAVLETLSPQSTARKLIQQALNEAD